MEQLNIFLLFPESDDEILALGDDCGRYLDIPKQLSLIKAIIKGHNHRFFYDSKNVTEFCSKAVDLCGNTYLDGIRNQLLSLLNKNATDTAKLPLFKSDCFYYQWNASSIIPKNDFLFRSATEKLIMDGNENTVIVSFLFQDKWPRNIVPMIKDAPHYQELPIITKIPYFNPINLFIEWYNSEISGRTFTFNDVTRFEKTCYFWSKQRMYREKETGRFWYYDFFHKDNKEHYDVFDSTGHHIGEADCEGNIDFEKKDKDKSISDILR